MNDLRHKNGTIVEVVGAVRSQCGGDDRVKVVDYWPDDPTTIGFERATSGEAMVSVTTKGKLAGRYDVSVEVPDREAEGDPYLGSGCYSNCVIDGVLATVRKYVLEAS